MSRSVTRRAFVQRSVAGAAGLALGRVRLAGAPAIVRAGLPEMPFGVSAGMAAADRAVIWSRCDRAARMVVEYSTTDRFTDVKRITGPAALEGSDFTARTTLEGLPPGQHIFYRVRFEDLSELGSYSEPVQGVFKTPAAEAEASDLTIAWSADTVGQGWGINPDWGGLRLYETMLRAEPDVFINSGDTIYADQPVKAEVTLDDGTVWKNIVTEAKSKPCETVSDFRGAFQYNLQDAHMRRFNAAVAQIVQWDDHEVHDNWYPTRDLRPENRYTIASTALLAAHARQAFLEYNPIPLDGSDLERIRRVVPLGPLAEVFVLDLRSYRGANSPNRQPSLGPEAYILGPDQLAWFKARLAASRATWKVIACDMPIGLNVTDGRTNFDAVANADDGPPLGRELEFADLLRFIRDRRIRNVVWITADVHYCAAHHYHPSRARFTEFDPFWEFVAGPLNAGTFGPGRLDATFGPEVKFTGIPPGMKGNRPPSEGFQFFGKLRIDRRTRALTATLHNLAGETLFSQELAAEN
jgi:alkaline phosphatase D